MARRGRATTIITAYKARRGCTTTTITAHKARLGRATTIIRVSGLNQLYYSDYNIISLFCISFLLKILLLLKSLPWQGIPFQP